MPMHSDFVKILQQFQKRYGDKLGSQYFYAWVNKLSTRGYVTGEYKDGEKSSENRSIALNITWTNPLGFYHT